MSTLVAVLDADVLVPILSCDLLLSAFDEDLYRPVVTATILHETERTTEAVDANGVPCGDHLVPDEIVEGDPPTRAFEWVVAGRSS